MKKTYMKPLIKVKMIISDCILAGSGISVGGNTGIEIGEGDPPHTASSKTGGLWDADEPECSSSVWE